MTFKNTKTNFGAMSKIFHWLIAFLIGALLVMGFFMVGMEANPDKFKIYGAHKSFGLLVLWLAGLRLVWRYYTQPPEALDTHKKWEKLLSKAIHFLLYVVMIGMPLSGWIMSGAGKHGAKFFGYPMPEIFPKSDALSGLAHEAHEIIAYLLIVVIGLHVLGALKHHIIDKDNTLVRMFPKVLKKIWLSIVILFLVVFGFGVLKFGFINKIQKNVSDKVIQNIKLEDKIGGKTHNTHQWKIVQNQSAIEFETDVYETRVIGSFLNFDGNIIFNPDDLTSSKADINIDLKTVDSGDTERDSLLLGDAWFNVASYPVANFRSVEFRKMEAGRYMAIGNFGLVGKEVPLTFPFSLDIVENEEEVRAYVDGQFTLSRLDFDLGGEEWKSEDVVGHDVLVKLRLVAEKPTNEVN